MSIAVFGVTLGLIISVGLWIQSEIELRKKRKEEDTGQVCYFTFTEEQRSRIKILINQYYIQNPVIYAIGMWKYMGLKLYSLLSRIVQVEKTLKF